MKLYDTIPDFKAVTTAGPIDSFHKWMGNNWCILFSHPSDFTPVCTTELAKTLNLVDEFQKRNVKIIGLSCDTLEQHKKWLYDICACAGKQVTEFPFPIIADPNRELATILDMLDPMEMGTDKLPLPARAVFFIASDKTIRSMILYPATTGRNFNEILRVLDALMLSEREPVMTPEGWTPGSQCMVQPKLSDEMCSKMFGANVSQKQLPSGMNYLRFVPS